MPRITTTILTLSLLLSLVHGVSANERKAPRIKTVKPEIGATDVSPAVKEIRVTFDQDMNTGGMSWCGGGPRFPKIASKARWTSRRTCVLPVKLQKGKVYLLGVNSPSHKNFRSAAGIPVKPTMLCFATRGASPEQIAEVAPPKVAKLSIENGAKDVPPGRTKLSVTFDKPMRDSMSWCNGPDTPKLEMVQGSAWSDDKKTCSIMAVLEPGKDYTVFLNSKSYQNFANEIGVPLEPVAWKFSTAEK